MALPVMSPSMRFIDRLKQAARLEPVKKEITLSDGTDIVMWVTPLTAAERDRARKNARSDDPNAFALQLLIQKARDMDNQPLFAPGDASVLRNEVRDSDLQLLMLAVLDGSTNAQEEEEPSDMKSAPAATE